jgi:TPR repeat protein
MRRALLLLIVLYLAGCRKLPLEQAHFARGYHAYNRGDFQEALLYLKPLVEQNQPAAQLLMARMYANGQGVEEDMGKAELLRNLAAFQIYKKHPLPPGVVRPANATLKSIADRLDYYVDPEKAEKGGPVRDLSEILESLNAKPEADQAPPAGPPEPLPIPEPPQKPTPAQEGTPVEPRDYRRADQISLGLIRQAAEEGDASAMELLASAYTQGFYGLSPNAVQSARWAEHAKEARLKLPPLLRVEPMEQVPWVPLTLILSGGVAFVGLGVGRLWVQKGKSPQGKRS